MHRVSSNVSCSTGLRSTSPLEKLMHHGCISSLTLHAQSFQTSSIRKKQLKCTTRTCTSSNAERRGGISPASSRSDLDKSAETVKAPQQGRRASTLTGYSASITVLSHAPCRSGKRWIPRPEHVLQGEAYLGARATL